MRASAQSHKVVPQGTQKSSTVFVGMDVHKESIDITVAVEGGEVRRLGQIGGDRGSLLKMVRKQRSRGRELVFVYLSNFVAHDRHDVPFCGVSASKATGPHQLGPLTRMEA